MAPAPILWGLPAVGQMATGWNVFCRSQADVVTLYADTARWYRENCIDKNEARHTRSILTTLS